MKTHFNLIIMAVLFFHKERLKILQDGEDEDSPVLHRPGFNRIDDIVDLSQEKHQQSDWDFIKVYGHMMAGINSTMSPKN